eukprot:14105091-Heterocapsa_arctica.AAC.1
MSVPLRMRRRVLGRWLRVGLWSVRRLRLRAPKCEPGSAPMALRRHLQQARGCWPCLVRSPRGCRLRWCAWIPARTAVGPGAWP